MLIGFTALFDTPTVCKTSAIFGSDEAYRPLQSVVTKRTPRPSQSPGLALSASRSSKSRYAIVATSSSRYRAVRYIRTGFSESTAARYPSRQDRSFNLNSCFSKSPFHRAVWLKNLTFLSLVRLDSWSNFACGTKSSTGADQSVWYRVRNVLSDWTTSFAFFSSASDMEPIRRQSASAAIVISPALGCPFFWRLNSFMPHQLVRPNSIRREAG